MNCAQPQVKFGVVIYTDVLTVWAQESVYIVHAICKFQALLNLVNTCYDVL